MKEHKRKGTGRRKGNRKTKKSRQGKRRREHKIKETYNNNVNIFIESSNTLHMVTLNVVNVVKW